MPLDRLRIEGVELAHRSTVWLRHPLWKVMSRPFPRHDASSDHRHERACCRVDGRDYWEGTVRHQVGTRHLRGLPVKCSQALPELGRERLVRVAAVQLAVQLATDHEQ
jgi:hypothetical protein